MRLTHNDPSYDYPSKELESAVDLVFADVEKYGWKQLTPWDRKVLRDANLVKCYIDEHWKCVQEKRGKK